MALCFNEATVAAEPLGRGAARQHLLTAARVPGTNIALDRITLAPGGTLPIDVPAGNLAWLQMLDGEAVLAHGERTTLTAAHVVLVPPRFSTSLSSAAGATLLYGEIADAGRFDPGLAAAPPRFRIVDWMREPVLDSKHDARKRIYLVTPKLFGTRAVKAEMIIYPPGTQAANHHHEGAEHFMYFLRGHGTAYANEQPFPVRAGDLVHYADRERHYLAAAADAEMVFAEFFVPGELKTVWVDPASVCTWLPTGRDIRGQAPARDIGAHSTADEGSLADV